MPYTVTAPLVIAKSREGGDVYLYREATVPDGQTDEWIAAHTRDGMIAQAGTPEGIPAERGESEDAPETRRTRR